MGDDQPRDGFADLPGSRDDGAGVIAKISVDERESVVNFDQVIVERDEFGQLMQSAAVFGLSHVGFASKVCDT